MVSIVILNYNSSTLSKQCVDSIVRHVKTDLEIVVVDNSSTKEDYDNLTTIIPPPLAHIVRCRWNGGFGAGNMFGANFTHGDFLLFLNSDTIMTEDCVTPLCRYLDDNPSVGCITPQQYNPDGQLVAAFSHSLGIRHEVCKDKLFELLMPRAFPRRDRITEPTTVDHINGCFMLFRTRDFWDIGGFDTNIFLYCEEADIATRLRMLGLSSVVHPAYRFTHIGSATTRKSGRQRVRRELYLSRVYVYSKYHGMIPTAGYRLVLTLKCLVNPRKWHILSAMLRGEVMSLSMKHKLRLGAARPSATGTLAHPTT